MCLKGGSLWPALWRKYMSGLDIFALVVLVILVIMVVAIWVFLSMMPGKILLRSDNTHRLRL